MSSGDGLSLSFVDLLYAVPLADLAEHISNRRAKFSAAGWAGIALVFVVIVLSWYGYHRNRRKSDRSRTVSEFGFFEWRFLQFQIDIWLVVVYFFMADRALVAAGQAKDIGASVVKLQIGFLVAIFALYFAWDLMDIHLIPTASDGSLDPSAKHWLDDAVRGSRLTAVALGVLVVALVVIDFGPGLPDRPAWVSTVDLVLIAALYLYRAVQDPHGQNDPSTPKGHGHGHAIRTLIKYRREPSSTVGVSGR